MKIIPILTIAAGIIASPTVTTAQYFLTGGLIAHYRLNGNANDSSGSNNGTIAGATPTLNRLGQPNSAYSFNGSSSRIEFSAPPLTQVTNCTIAAWLNPGSFAMGLALYVGADNGALSDGFGFGTGGSGNLHGFIPAEAGFFNTGSPFPGLNQWCHVAMVRTNGVTSFYINGVRTANQSTANVSTPSDFTIGSQNGIRYFSGAVDDVRIFNRALASNEVAQLAAYDESYAETNAPPPSVFCSPHAATATATLFNGFLVGINITDPGCGYTNAPLVAIQGGGGSNAMANATISNGQVTAINITSAGCCYTSPPKIVMASPPFVPVVSIGFSRVYVAQRIVLGRHYVLESTTNFVDWIDAAPPFTADSETVTNEFVIVANRYFRVREIP